MITRIGLLLPRSTDYPAMGYDMLDGLRCRLTPGSDPEYQFYTENIGFGENNELSYSKAEKLFLQDKVDILIAYCNSANAEALYQLAGAFQKPLLILDAGMQLPQEKASPWCYHITLQGLHGCRIAGNMSGTGNRNVLMATSFYDGGYRGPWSYDRGLSEAGGAVCGNYVSGYRTAEFNIDQYISLLKNTEAASVAACFSSYLAELFFNALNEKNSEAIPVPFYCAPFMAEEQLLSKCNFPGGEFYTVVPWSSALENPQQTEFTNSIRQATNKAANIFHLLGWEAGIVTIALVECGIQSLKDFSYLSPRGKTTIHPETHYTYAPLYKGKIIGGQHGKCALQITETIPPDAGMHIKVMSDQPTSFMSGWKNNYLCI
ncbi:amino acid/amide ABC transporter substrate-binding protein, HAAT family [Niastella koreensis GR20-10]|uniref:Amino acid/amide ABC transporter substrate-binding protein, HAAT family n=2 Tax=Niastella koreensis TaxID=354356 RepID=G8THK2_NIAKG|nr:ABC transporter substrate-binding protein [Niastella koreensis]AEV97430.1 amino acid/amide ABC transporter substrate-binding protein, HAAT family [Niastella koreensis GR20-10]